MLLAFDLDNTIVTHDNEIPPRILSAVGAAKAAGHQVAVLTGRPKASALPFVQQLGVSGPYAVNHGALVMGQDDTVLSRALISADDVGMLIERYGVRQGLEYAFMIDDDIFVADPSDPRWSWAHTLNRNVLTFQPELVRDADKIVFGADAAAPQLLKELNASHPELMKYAWPDGFFEITGAGAHKGAALARICVELGVAQRDTVAFGDGVNDVTMMHWAGRAVAVGVAHPEVAAAADDHIAEPEADGVAAWLTEHLLGVGV
jgi:Cof subfamily protein (haloacid dehalogenase superfamily)